MHINCFFAPGFAPVCNCAPSERPDQARAAGQGARAHHLPPQVQDADDGEGRQEEGAHQEAGQRL